MPAATAFAPSLASARARTVAGGGAVARDLLRVSGGLTDEPGAQILHPVFELDLLRDGHAVLGDPPIADRGLVDHGPTLRAERHRYGVGKDIDTLEEARAGLLRLMDLLLGHRRSLRIRCLCGRALRYSITPMMSDSFMINSSSPSTLTSVPDHLPNRMRSPALTSSGDELAVLSPCAGSCGDDLAFLRLLLGGVGNDDAARRFLVLFDPPHQHAVVQRPDVHTALRAVTKSNGIVAGASAC